MTWAHFWFNIVIATLLTLGIKFIFHPAWWVAILIAVGIVAGVWLIANSDEVVNL